MLLDPSCSGSGTAANRLDALLPSRRRRAADADKLNEVCAPSFQADLISVEDQWNTLFLAVQTMLGLNVEQEKLRILNKHKLYLQKLHVQVTAWWYMALLSHIMLTNTAAARQRITISTYVKCAEV